MPTSGSIDTASTSSTTTELLASPTAALMRERMFACPEPGCTGRFHRKFTLREHIKTHTGEKPYQCPIKSCGKRFTTSGNLSRHRHMHMAKRVCCPVLECGRRFTKQEKLLRHLKVHMGSAAHACNFPGCPKTFSTSGNLSRHQRTQHRSVVLPSPSSAFVAKFPLSPANESLEELCRSPIDIGWQMQQTFVDAPLHDDLDNDVYDMLDGLFDPAAPTRQAGSFGVDSVIPGTFDVATFSFAHTSSQCTDIRQTQQEPELYAMHF